jgi:hypothetical protein
LAYRQTISKVAVVVEAYSSVSPEKARELGLARLPEDDCIMTRTG